MSPAVLLPGVPLPAGWSQSRRQKTATPCRAGPGAGAWPQRARLKTLEFHWFFFQLSCLTFPISPSVLEEARASAGLLILLFFGSWPRFRRNGPFLRSRLRFRRNGSFSRIVAAVFGSHDIFSDRGRSSAGTDLFPYRRFGSAGTDLFRFTASVPPEGHGELPVTGPALLLWKRRRKRTWRMPRTRGSRSFHPGGKVRRLP